MEKLGILLLTVGAIAAVWSALMPSFFTIMKFGVREGTEEDKRDLLIGGICAAITIILVLTGVYLLYWRKKEG